jgi:hypothetical protein
MTTAREPGKCGSCGAQRRRSNVRVADAPGTRPRQREGLCVACYRVQTWPKTTAGYRIPGASRRSRDYDPAAPPDPKLVEWRAEYDADRRARGIPPEGSDPEPWLPNHS